MTYLNSFKKFIQDDFVRFSLLFLFIIQYSNVYRVTMRSLYEGGDFEWMQTWGVTLLGEERTMRIMGNGYEGHFLIMLLFGILFTVIVFMIIRRSDDILSKVLLVLYTGILTVKEVMLSIAYGNQYKITGETFRLQLDYSIMGPLLSIVIFGLAIWWAVRQQHTGNLGKVSVKVSWIIWLLSIPCFLFLRLGEQHDLTDIVGVSFIYMQFTILVLNWMGVFKNY